MGGIVVPGSTWCLVLGRLAPCSCRAAVSPSRRQASPEPLHLGVNRFYCAFHPALFAVPMKIKYAAHFVTSSTTNWQEKMPDALNTKGAEKQPMPMSVLDLPRDAIQHILGLSSGRTVARAAQTCSALRSQAESPHLWRNLCERAGVCFTSPAATTPPEASMSPSKPAPDSQSSSWRERYIACATCDHSNGPRRQLDWWRRGDAATSGVYLDPSRGAVRTGCACAACGREFEVLAKAEYDADDHAFGRCSEEFSAVRTKLRFRARRLSGDEIMDQQWDEERSSDFCFYTSE